MSVREPTEAQIEKAFDTFQNTSASLPLRDRLAAVLLAVGPDIAASTLRDAAVAIPGSTSAEQIDPYDLSAEWLIGRADWIEKEARRG